MQGSGGRAWAAGNGRPVTMTAIYSASGNVMPAKKRELLDTGTDKRYIRRDERGRFTKDQVDVGRSSAADQRQRSSGTSKPGQGDKGDRRK